MLKVKQFIVNHFMENCFVLYDEVSCQCAIVDPGMTAVHEFSALYAYIEQEQLLPTYVLLTHAHVDHVAGLKAVCEHYNLPATLHADGVKLLCQAAAYGTMMSFDDLQPLDTLPRNLVDDNTTLPLGESTIEVRYVPGHAEGSLCYVADQMVLTGDALFRGSIGRTDLPGGDYDLLMEKIRSRLLTLPDDYEVLPGHGELSTIGIERRSNPFL